MQALRLCSSAILRFGMEGRWIVALWVPDGKVIDERKAVLFAAKLAGNLILKFFWKKINRL
jgi:hypothetical protein